MKTIYFSKDKSQRILVTFGSGSTWKWATQRLTRQARKSHKFDLMLIYNEHDVFAIDPEFRDFLKQYPKGFGLWKWKPLIIQETTRMYPGLQLLVYLDAGCEINSSYQALSRFDEYVSIAENEGALAFELPLLEKNWSHPSLLEKFKVHPEDKQIAGGILFFMNSELTKSVVDDWRIWMNKERSKYLIGDSATGPVSSDFNQHRYDQSIISVLWRKYNLSTLADETYWGPDWSNNGNRFPIWATRNKLPISYNSNSILTMVFRVLVKIYSKIKG